ncbi:helix-turn-helix domain-containing protein [Staphylococcus saprophyticus]|uniref:helix-turn-helix domain-containing protein n=1 Tax=Staphylococcus saprophyticus TaxID=29385 RepID=UPI001013C96B|nr:helix-turn-helix domain-containing protein [Staphylococcus saprophyticus]MBN6092366.1 helix-turn-helix domain-containing protein [Staphylococcus saprophyticus]MDW4312500.1 helix-turn-helix domain-containing protein [Staphylococcus saprophyticus]MDW4371589.1 helix-turn-helix domain-containing protein [Staphylococcus saprophyticus]RXS01980.1 helix-turn-helix domain-containing protein [Staphylococcus saprophyticus]
MGAYKLNEEPTKENTVLEPEQVKAHPIYCAPKSIGELFGFSRSTTSRLLNEYKENDRGVKDMYLSLSSTLVVIKIEKFEEWLKLKNGEWL